MPYRAEVYFVVSVSESWRLVGCAAKRDQEAHGLFGFHSFTSCPDCVLTFEGWELWGENGHKQGAAKDRAGLAHMLRYRAMRPWRMQDGRLMGYRFKRGGKIYFSL
jgi:hypothetical protein